MPAYSICASPKVCVVIVPVSRRCFVAGHYQGAYLVIISSNVSYILVRNTTGTLLNNIYNILKPIEYIFYNFFRYLSY